MRSLVFFAGLLSSVLAGVSNYHGPPCMSAVQAQEVANHFKTLLEDFDASDAKQWLTKDFTDYSSSVNTLINFGCTAPKPLEEATFTSRHAFIEGQGSQPSIPFEQLNLWHTCDSVFLRWRTTVSPESPEMVAGIVVLEVEYSGCAFLIKTIYSEFNSGAWLVDLGTFIPTCSASRRSIPPSLSMRMA